MAPLVAGPVAVSDDGRHLSAGVDSSTGLATVVVRALDDAGVLVDNIEVRQPSLDDVFFSLTGGHIEEEGAAEGDGAGGRAQARALAAPRLVPLDPSGPAKAATNWKEYAHDNDHADAVRHRVRPARTQAGTCSVLWPTSGP